MKASKIIEMWGRASCQVPLTSDDEIVQMFANEIAKLSYKLTEEELYRLIAVGALVYQRGFREFDNLRISRAGYSQFVFLGAEPFNNVLLIKGETEFLRELAAARQLQRPVEEKIA